MAFQEAHHTIDAIKRLAPSSLIFILDTMDRSFVYCSKDRHACKQLIIDLDIRLGIEKLSKSTGFYRHEEKGMLLRLKKLSGSTFMGFCMESDQKENQNLEKAEALLEGLSPQ